MTDIQKTYDPKAVEAKWYRFWMDNDLFHTAPFTSRKPYCIMMPPPNVTGELHMGHALQDAIQDMLIRLKKMQGYESHWQPGKDHAGIATQNVVEKSLEDEGISRHDLGREKFVERVWEWKEKFGNRIFEQKQMLGDCADWKQERFTLDPGLSRAVARVFTHLYDKGLIYRGHYIVNWCPRCHTAISDEEVVHEEQKGHLWYFKYPIKEGVRGGEYVIVATTRPETMLGDTAVAVNPRDERMMHLHGKTIILPLVGREMPVILDEHVDPEFGTGQVKVTPAHDPNDFEMGKRHNLDFVVVLDENGAMNDNVPEQFRGLDRFKAREAVVKALDEEGLIEKIEDYTNAVGHCQRCRTIIEPYQSLQWFVKMKPLAEPALEAVRDGRIRFFPDRWAKVYYQWMENIRDWCISRQLWWGHRFPVWYCQDCEETIVRETPPEKCPKCSSNDLQQEEDVLDTWFSSWLWPFSTLGWPDDTREMKFWYPTDVLVTGYDIIFFWVARMIMAGIEFTGKIPYRHVYITGMIKDELGRWMSKSLGNGIDPADMIDQYGADAVRFTLVSLATEGQDIKLTPSRFEGGRNFANKLWNSYRFLMTNVAKLEKPLEIDDPFILTKDARLADRWIVGRLHAAIEKVLENADKYRLSDSLNTLYDFVWKDYCDWYLEVIKVRLSPENSEEVKHQTLSLAVGIFEVVMRLLHPGMPFITEELWQGMQLYFKSTPPSQSITGKDGTDANGSIISIMHQPYPRPEEFPLDEDALQKMGFIQRLISAVRNIRSEMSVPPGKKADLMVSGCDDQTRALINGNLDDIKKLAAVDEVRFNGERPPQSASAVVDDVELFVPLAGLIDIDVEQKRLDKEISRLSGVIMGAEKKLSNPKFMERAPDDVKEHERQKLEDCRRQLEIVEKNRQVLN